MAKGETTASPESTEASQEDVPLDEPRENHAPDLYHYDTYAETLDTLDDITDEQIRFFHEQGYLSVQHVLEPSEVEAAGQAMWDLIDGNRPDFRGVQVEGKMRKKFPTLPPQERRDAVRKIAKFIDYDDHLKALTEHPGILQVLTRIMGEPPVLFQDMGLMKPPYVGREKPWHQDNAYFNLPVETTTVGVWIALDEATPENGCLHIVPGSHREGPMPHFRRRDWQICDTDARVDRDVLVPLKPGGCLFWHGLTHHGSPTNHTADRRRALQYHYKPASTPDITVDDRLGIYGGEGLGIEC